MPKLSIVTTVYDRVDCLRRCIASVKELNFTDYEHIIVSDCPPDAVAQEITALVAEQNDWRIRYFNLSERGNNWGIAPLNRGLKECSGDYVAILSDDNGYLPHHFDALIPAMDANNALSFVYSACWYRDMGLFAHAHPEDCKIDLGQPLFRRRLFNSIFGDIIPFNIYGFDWRIIHSFVKAGKWQFFNDPTFVFRLSVYPQYFPKMQPKPIPPQVVREKPPEPAPWALSASDVVTVVIVYQDSMPWLDLCLEGLKTFKNKTPMKYIFVENTPYHDRGAEVVDAFIASTPDCEKIVTAAPPCTDGRAHEHGLNLAYLKVTTEWTLFMDADTVVLKDGWLDEMMASGADMIGPVPDSGIADYSLPILHPCLLLFRTKLASPPYWNRFFGRWNKLQTIDGSDWDVCRPFTYHVGIRADVKQIKLCNTSCREGPLLYFALHKPDDPAHPLAMHLREGSKSLLRHQGDDRHILLKSHPKLSWYKKEIEAPFDYKRR